MNLLGMPPRGKSAVKFFAVLHQGDVLIDGMFDSTLAPKNCEENVDLIAKQLLVDGKLYTSNFSESNWSYQSIGDDIKLVVVTHPRLAHRQRLAMLTQLLGYLQDYQQYYNRTRRDDILDSLKPEMYKVIHKLNKTVKIEELENLDELMRRETNRQERFKDEDYNPKEKKAPVIPQTPERKLEEMEEPKISVPNRIVVETAEPKYVLQNDLKDDEKKDKPKKKGFFKTLFGFS